jgi:hypothetical protein
MAVKILVALIITVVALFGLHTVWTNYQLKHDFRRDSFDKLIKKAKAEGKQEIQLLPPIPYYASVNSLDEALVNYSTVLAKPVSVHVQLNSESQNIETWYKMQVVDFLSQPNQSKPCSACRSRQGETIPPKVFPTQENEFVLVRNTGSLVSDGIKVTSNDATFPDFELNQTYLLFLSLDLTTKIAAIELGPAGVAKVNSDGELAPVNESQARLSETLAHTYGKVDKIKEQLKLRRFPN